MRTNILLICWLRIIDFDRSFFAARITTRLVITDLTPRDHRREGSSRFHFPRQCFGRSICKSFESMMSQRNEVDPQMATFLR